MSKSDELEIDAVIAWVDGSDPLFRASRDSHAAKSRNDPLDPDHESQLAFSNVRYEDCGELRYCLRSIFRFGGWIRKIWVVTAGQFPRYLDRSRLPSDKIQFVSHDDIFRGYENYLPTFNSETIETMIWRIDGLADRFLYFNDDVMLLAGARREHFFADRIRLHGLWKGPELLETAKWMQSRYNAARLCGFEAQGVFIQAHTAHPLIRSEFAALFAGMEDVFLENLRHRFRSPNSVYPVSLLYHRLIELGRAEVRRPVGTVVIDRPESVIQNGGVEHLRGRLIDPKSRMACFNNYSLLKRQLPGVEELLDDVFGPPLDFER